MNKTETTVSGVKAPLRRNWTGGWTSGQLFTLEIPENAWLVKTYVKTTEGLHRYYAQDGCIKGYFDKWTRTHCPRPHNMAKFTAALRAEKNRKRARMAPRPYSKSSHRAHRRSHSPINWRRRNTSPKGSKHQRAARRDWSSFSSDTSTRAWGSCDSDAPTSIKSSKQSTVQSTADNLKVRQESPRKPAPPGLVKIAVVDPEPTAFTGEWKSTQPEVSDVLPPVKQECTLAEVKQEAATYRGAGEDFPEEEHSVFTEHPASPTKAEPGDKLCDIGRSGYNTKAWSYVDNLVPTPCVKCLNATSPKGLCGECSSLLSEKDTLIKEVMMPDEGDQPEPPTNKVTPATYQESIPDLVGSGSTSEGEDIPPKLPVQTRRSRSPDELPHGPHHTWITNSREGKCEVGVP